MDHLERCGDAGIRVSRRNLPGRMTGPCAGVPEPCCPDTVCHAPAIAGCGSAPGSRSCLARPAQVSDSPASTARNRGSGAQGRFTGDAARLVLLVVGAQMRTSRKALLQASRGTARVCQARQIAMYLLHTALSCSYQEVAAIFGRDRTTVSHACRLVEDMRDDPQTDGKLLQMEEIISAALALRHPSDRPAMDGR